MQVSEILAAKGDRVISIASVASVGDVASTLRREGIGAAVVKSEGKDMAGIISERDIVASLADHGPAALEMHAADLMNRSVITCTPESSTQEIMEQMLMGQIRHLPVVKGDALVGMISVGDVVKAVLSELKWMTKVLQDQVVTAAAWSTDED
ncbi:MAG: CBS domain-containing protein [Kiloniellales bacterium]|nr:CBS domain-containing protein [Kiloniellales bacterium]MDJ0969072.1 CBS domain-containing protein [Kiloniellales bacterium]MDJ0982218.1 CBS domain-containing protein [Kiloniellales bacterium]